MLIQKFFDSGSDQCQARNSKNCIQGVLFIITVIQYAEPNVYVYHLGPFCPYHTEAHKVVRTPPNSPRQLYTSFSVNQANLNLLSYEIRLTTTALILALNLDHYHQVAKFISKILSFTELVTQNLIGIIQTSILPNYNNDITDKNIIDLIKDSTIFAEELNYAIEALSTIYQEVSLIRKLFSDKRDEKVTDFIIRTIKQINELRTNPPFVLQEMIQKETGVLGSKSIAAITNLLITLTAIEKITQEIFPELRALEKS